MFGGISINCPIKEELAALMERKLLARKNLPRGVRLHVIRLFKDSWLQTYCTPDMHEAAYLPFLQLIIIPVEYNKASPCNIAPSFFILGLLSNHFCYSCHDIMRIFLFLCSIIVSQFFSRVQPSLLSKALLGQRNSLKSRQTPPVITASASPRRAYRACKCFET